MSVFSGRVLSLAYGTPLPGLPVELTLERLPGRERKTLRSESGAAGEFRFDLEGAVLLERVRVHAGSRHARMELLLLKSVRRGERPTRDLFVPVGGVVSGHIADLQGRPIPNARILGWSDTLESVDSAASRAPDCSTTSALDGGFTLHGLGPEFVLEAEAPGRVCRQRAHGRVEPLGEVSGVQLVMADSVLLTGRVLDDSGAPVAGAAVRSEADWTSTRGTGDHVFATGAGPLLATTNAAGSFHLEDVAAQQRAWTVEVAGTVRWRGHWDPARGPLEVRLGPATCMEGVVVDAAGTPVPGCELRLDGRNLRAARTDCDGRFLLEELEPDPCASLVATTSSRGSCRLSSLVLAAGKAVEMRLVLERPWPLAGVVVDTTGAPVPGAEVSIRRELKGADDLAIGSGRAWCWRAPGNARSTDGAGRFRFEHLYTGKFELEVVLPASPAAPRRFPAVAGREDLVLEVDLSAEGERRLAGRVFDALDRRPVRSFEVLPLQGRNGLSHGRTRQLNTPTGEFRLDGLPEGALELQVQAPGYAPFSKMVLATDRDVLLEVALTPARDVVLRVVDASGEPVSGAELTFFRMGLGEPVRFWTGPSAHAARARTGPDGSARVLGLPAAFLEVRIEVEKGRESWHDLDLEVDLRATFELDLEH